ncbi:MAG: IS110 family transposase [Chlamydiales bacterium]
MNYSQTIAIPKLFIGIDVHKKSWTAHFKTDLFDYKTVTMPASPPALMNYIEKHFSHHEITCCYEAGCCGYWIARTLEQSGWKVLVVNPGDVPRTHKQDWQKTDKIDCRILCSQLQKGNLHSIYVPGVDQEDLRALFRRRIHLARQLRTIKSHIKSQLLYFGIQLPLAFDNPNWSQEMKNWIRDIQWPLPAAALTMESRLKHLDFIWYELLHISTELRAHCRKFYKKDYYLLKSVPGIGGITAAAILAELGDIRRFNEDQLAALVGFIPGIYQSSDNKICLGLTKRSNRELRSLLVEATWVAVRADMALQAYYRKHVHADPRKAIIKMAHKLLARIRAVIVSEVPYQTGLVK